MRMYVCVNVHVLMYACVCVCVCVSTLSHMFVYSMDAASF